MKKAYIILVHDYPELLERTLERLDDGHSVFFIHLDKKSDAQKFDGLKRFGNRVRLVSNVKAYWGGLSLIHAVLNALNEVRKEGGFERIVLLSGQDYPIKSNDEIDRFFRESQHSVFLEYFKLPDNKKWAPLGGIYRVNKYFLGLGLHQKMQAKLMNGMSAIVPHLQRKLPIGFEPYAGSMWWILDEYAMNFILDFVDEHPEYLRFHRYTFASDELFFHMILLNADDARLRNSIANDNKRYIRWKEISSSHPETIVETEMDKLAHSDALFARKFHPQASARALDLIDQDLL